MAHAIKKDRIDWALFLVVVVASQGLSAFLPGRATSTAIAVSSAIMALSVLPQLGRVLSVMLSNPLVVFLTAWSLAAGIVSQRPVLAVLFAGVLTLTIVFASLRQGTQEGTLKTFALAAAVSLVPSIAGLVTPVVPVFRHAGSAGGYAGYFPWNSSAGLCAAAALLSLVLVYFQSGPSWWHIPAAAGAVLMLVLSKSATAALALVAAVGALGAQAALRRASDRTKPLVFVIMGTIALSALPKGIELLSRKSVAEATGRTESFSSRTVIWQWARQGISESPFWGYGTEFWRDFGAWNNSGHNGFIDIALAFGVPAALALCAITVVAAVRLALASSILLSFLVFGVTANLAVSQLASPTIPSLALWLAVGSTLHMGRTGEPDVDDQTSAAIDRPSPRAARVWQR